MRRLLLILALLVLPASAALASQPTSGEVSPSSPRTEWKGSTTSSYPNYVTMNQNPDGVPCQTPTCDSFALKVVEGGVDLVIRANMDRDGTTGPANTGVRITKPDGTKVWQTGPSGATAELKVVVKKAPAGNYVIDLANNFVGPPQTYSASAELAVPAAPAPAAPAPADPAGGQPAGPAAETTLTVEKASARAGRKVTTTVTASAPVSRVTAILTRGGKRFASGRLASLSGTRKVTVKGKKKLKPGKYLLTVSGTDEQGRKATGKAPVTVRR